MFVNGQVLNLTIGEETVVCESLTQVADALAERWSEGIDVMLQIDDEEQFDTVKMGKDLYGMVRVAREKMQNVEEKRCESVNAEFFKFLYRFVSDKKTFRWGDLPGITTGELFATKLYATLNTIRHNGNNFGEWWKNMYDGSKNTSTAFAEIFRNNVFSTYLKANNEQNQQLLEQCRKVEEIFRTAKPVYSIEELYEMYMLVFEILGDKGKTFTTAHGTKYNSYMDFAMEVKQCLGNKQNPNQIFTVWESVTEGEYFAPDFFAWLKKYDPQYAKDIKHHLNIK